MNDSNTPALSLMSERSPKDVTVRLNVMGTMMEVETKLLFKNSNKLKDLLSEHVTTPIYIDADPDIFRKVLQLCRLNCDSNKMRKYMTTMSEFDRLFIKIVADNYDMSYINASIPV